MSGVRSMDKRLADLWVLEAQGVCEPTPIQYRGNGNKNWPFRFSIKEGCVLVNTARQETRYESAKKVGEALL